jgi:hypothetical protein
MKKYIYKIYLSGSIFIVLLLALIIKPETSKAQIDSVIIEKYYIADTFDATDTTQGRTVDSGSVTYRIYLDLKAGSKLLAVYGDQHHPIQIKSTAPFYNNPLQPGSNFGYLLNKNLFPSVPTLALDSWLTIGYAAKNQSGILKTQDTDGNYFAGALNSGGSSSILGGILANADPSAGVPLTTSDGMMTNNTILSTWLDNGFKDGSGIDTTVFGPVTIGNEFYSYNSFLQQSNGVMGGSPDSTIVLVAQLTTTGTISFKLNVVIEQFDGTTSTIVKYVSSSDSLQPDEVVSPLLVYPQECGCTDPDYFEFNPIYSCNIADSCKTLIRFGCTDTVACNYDADANFNIPELCCYPGLCQDRDLAQVCPELSNLRSGYVSSIYPVPAKDQLHVVIHPGNGIFLNYTIRDVMGKVVMKHSTGSVTGSMYTDLLDVTSLNPGLYFLHVETGSEISILKFIIEG